MSAPITQGTIAQNDSDALPGNWYATDASEVARFKHPSGALIRIRREIPLRSAEAANEGRHGDADGELVVLHHSNPLPSEAEEIHRGGTESEGRDAARSTMLDRSEDC